MKNKNWIIPALIAILLVSSFFIIGYSSHASVQKEKSTCCSQKMSTGSAGKGCDGGIKTTTPGDMILENFSRQFLTISPLGN
jgi:hypothetical protein